MEIIMEKQMCALRDTKQPQPEQLIVSSRMLY